MDREGAVLLCKGDIIEMDALLTSQPALKSQVARNAQVRLIHARSFLQRYQPAAQREANQVGLILQAEFSHQMDAMCLNGA